MYNITVTNGEAGVILSSLIHRLAYIRDIQERSPEPSPFLSEQVGNLEQAIESVRTYINGDVVSESKMYISAMMGVK